MSQTPYLGIEEVGYAAASQQASTEGLESTVKLQVVKPTAGYCSPCSKQILYVSTIVFTLGASWIFSQLSPLVMTLLRLRPCSLSSASVVRFKVIQAHTYTNTP